MEGKNIIGHSFSAEGTDSFVTYYVSGQHANSTSFICATSTEVNKAVELAEKAFIPYSSMGGKMRSEFLLLIKNKLESSRKDLIHIYCEESSLSSTRGHAELDRTLFQLDTFAKVALTQSWILPIIDQIKDKEVDLRKTQIPVGPVVVFGASNFPLAYSTIGGDTASALAIGCPVIVKAHPLHAETSSFVAKKIMEASIELNLPEGIFSHLLDNGYSIGKQLVLHPSIKAIGFTGSIKGGTTLIELSQSRKEPIPVFAEMGSTNPVIVFDEEIETKMDLWSDKLIYSISNDAGQFCTKPGILFIHDSEIGNLFINHLIEKAEKVEAQPMIHPALFDSFKQTVSTVDTVFNLKKSNEVITKLKVINSTDFQSNPLYHQEFFGPFALIVKYLDQSELEENIKLLHGQLTGTILAPETIKDDRIRSVMELLKDKVGRLIFNGVPTGVHVCDAMHHGGPYPASSDSRFSAVGGLSTARFTKEICFQNYPEHLLPEELKDTNKAQLLRKVNGDYSKSNIS